MDIEPVRPGRGSRDRVLGRLALVLPAVLLAGVVVTAVSSRTDRSERPATPTPTTVAEVPRPSAPPSPEPRSTIRLRPATTPPPYPAEIAGIPVDPMYLAAELGEVYPEDRLIAVGGWLSLAPLGKECLEGLGAPGWRVYCPRLAMLYGSSGWPTDTLRVELQPGIALPERRPGSEAATPWTAAIPVVVIGHFTDRRARGCDLRPPRCGPILTIERVAWWDGGLLDHQVAVGPGGYSGGDATRDGIDDAALAAIRGAEEVLSITVLGRAALEALHPEAAANVPPDGRVWYVRAVTWRHAANGPYEPAVGWAVVDAETRTVLGAQPRRQLSDAS